LTETHDVVGVKKLSKWEGFDVATMDNVRLLIKELAGRRKEAGSTSTYGEMKVPRSWTGRQELTKQDAVSDVTYMAKRTLAVA
jgi:hypothetical protein